MTRRLILFVSSFPYGVHEPYLEREVDFYGSFDEIIIFSLSVKENELEIVRSIDNPRIQIVPILFKPRMFYAINAVTAFFSPAFWCELTELLRRRQLSLKRVVQALAFFSRADYEARQAKSYLRANVIDMPGDSTVLYAYRFYYQPYILSKLVSLYRSVRCIARAHGIDLYEERWATNYLPNRRGNLDVLDELHVVSENGRDYLRQRYPDSAGKIVTSYLGTGDYGIAQKCSSRRPLRVVSCSNVVPVKRLNLLVDALGVIPDSVEIKWTHFGDGPDMSQLKKRAAELPSHIEVNLRGRTPNTAILESYQSGEFHVLVNVSSSEGLPVSLMEAASSGIPAIATNVGGTNEIIEDGVTGFLLPPVVNAEQISEMIIRFADMMDQDYQRMRTACRERWQSSFDADVNYSGFVEAMISGFR